MSTDIMTEDHYLIKLKGAKIPDKYIAKRLNITLEEVDRRWKAIQASTESASANGYSYLIEVANHLCWHYQEIGEKLKVVATALNNTPSLGHIQRVVEAGDPATAAERLVKAFMILSILPVPPTPPNINTEVAQPPVDPSAN